MRANARDRYSSNNPHNQMKAKSAASAYNHHMSKYVEWDYDFPGHRQRQRRPKPPLEGEILTPVSEPPTARVHVHHHRSDISPNVFMLGALVFSALRFLPYIGIGLL